MTTDPTLAGITGNFRRRKNLAFDQTTPTLHGLALRFRAMRVGVYVDGFNLYYGGVSLAGGHGRPGWRWLDIRSLSARLIAAHSGWVGASIIRVSYCTARISGADNPSGQRDQDTYLRALVAAKAVDHIEYGTYVARVAIAPLATKGAKGKPVLVTAGWPVCVKDQNDHPVPQARFMVSVARREEKGSDVNVASHLLIDTLQGDIDAAVVISNDSDLAYPISVARTRIPVGLINPSVNYTAGALRADRSIGVGNHWFYSLAEADLQQSQLPLQIGRLTAPSGW